MFFRNPNEEFSTANAAPIVEKGTLSIAPISTASYTHVSRLFCIFSGVDVAELLNAGVGTYDPPPLTVCALSFSIVFEALGNSLLSSAKLSVLTYLFKRGYFIKTLPHHDTTYSRLCSSKCTYTTILG